MSMKGLRILMINTGLFEQRRYAVLKKLFNILDMLLTISILLDLQLPACMLGINACSSQNE